MSFEIFDKFDETKNFLPKFDMPVNAESNDSVGFGRNNDIVDCISMHVADLIILGRWDVLEQ